MTESKHLTELSNQAAPPWQNSCQSPPDNPSAPRRVGTSQSDPHNARQPWIPGLLVLSPVWSVTILVAQGPATPMTTRSTHRPTISLLPALAGLVLTLLAGCASSETNSLAQLAEPIKPVGTIASDEVLLGARDDEPGE